MSRSVATAILLCLTYTRVYAADTGQSAFVTGLDQLANANWKEAADSFQKAVDADDEKTAYHLNLGIALTMSGDPAGAKKALARASKLEPRNPDVTVWAYARLQMYESTAFGGSPPYRATPYASKLVDNAIAYGSPRGGEAKDKAWVVIVDVAKQYAWAALGNTGAPVMTDRVAGLYKEGKYADCLALINKLRAAGPIDYQMTGYSAHCKLALGDYQGSRDEYTIALKAQPTSASYLIGRARTEIALGAMRDADADFALARDIDPVLTDKFVKDAEKLIADARAKTSTKPPAVLWANLKQNAVDNKPEEQLVSVAEQLIRARTSARYVRDEEYTRELTRLQTLVNRDPKNAGALIDTATFLLNPTVVRKVALAGVDATARIPIGTADAKRAETYLGDALKIEPANVRAMEQTAILYVNYNRPNDMSAWVHKALDGGALTLDLCEMHLHHYTNLASQCASEAAALRAPTITTYDQQEGNQIVTYKRTTPPSALALARADQLDRQAAEFRRKSVQPMQALSAKLKDSTDPHEQIDCILANANISCWYGKHDAAIATAESGLKIDPYHVTTLNYLINLCPKIGMGAKAVQYQDLLNNLANPSSGRTLDKIWPQLKQTRFKGAQEQLAAAEQIDPGSFHIASANFAIAQEQQKLDDAVIAGRILLAMEHARIAASGRSLANNQKSPLTGNDTVVSIYTRTALAKMLDDAGRFEEVLDHASRAVRLANRVPQSDWAAVVPETIIPNDPVLGKDIKSLYASSGRMVAYKLIAQGKHTEAIGSVVTLAQMEPPDARAMAIGYQIYQTTGFKPFQGKVPDGWLKMFEMWDHQRDNARQFGRGSGEPFNAEVEAIDQQIDKIDREIQRGISPADRMELDSKRDELLAKKAQLQTQRRQRGG